MKNAQDQKTLGIASVLHGKGIGETDLRIKALDDHTPKPDVMCII